MTEPKQLEAQARQMVDELVAEVADLRAQRDAALEARSRTMETNGLLQEELHRSGQRSYEVLRMVEELEHEKREAQEQLKRHRLAMVVLLEAITTLPAEWSRSPEMERAAESARAILAGQPQSS